MERCETVVDDVDSFLLACSVLAEFNQDSTTSQLRQATVTAVSQTEDRQREDVEIRDQLRFRIPSVRLHVSRRSPGVLHVHFAKAWLMSDITDVVTDRSMDFVGFSITFKRR
jgi:hypothetical protein